MGNEEEVLRIGKKLDKMVAKKEGFGQALDLLKALKDIPITLEILQRTRIGMAVNNLRKNCSNEDVITLAKQLIRQWKKLLEVQKEGKSDSNSDNNGTNLGKTSGGKSDSSGSVAAAGGGGGDSANKNGSAGKNTSSSIKNNSSSFGDNKPRQSFPSNTTNEIRLKGRQMLADALKAGLDADTSGETFFDPEDLAAQIEDCIFKEFKDTNPKYKNRLRSRLANLKDPKNPDLKFNVLRGHISAARIAVMTAEEMASKEMQELRQKLTKEAINDHQMAVTGGTKTDLIKCPKCKKTNTTYNQVQTRSADEPMTTFCYCNECGYRWKFC